MTKDFGVVHLEKDSKVTRGPKRTKKSNLIRNKLTEEDKNSLKYADFEELYTMWCEYFKDLAGGDQKEPDDRLMKTDYHGAMLMVNEADNKTMIGITGIVVMETRHTFQMITPNDKYVVIPKQGSTFQFILNNKIFTVFGDFLRYKPCLRGKRQRLRTQVPYFLR